MKLTDIKTFIAGNPAPGVGGRYFVFVKLTTDGNVHGIGEAYCVPFHPDVVARMLVDTFGRYLEGEDPHNIESIWRRVYSAGYTQHADLTLMAVLSALEMACWDIIGKEAGQPVYNLLGGRVHERLRSYTYIYARPGDKTDVYQDPDLAAERAAEYLAQGFTALKFDPGGPVLGLRRPPAVARGARAVRALRAAVARRGRHARGSAVRHARPDDRGGRDTARAATRALRSAVVRGAGAAGCPRGDGAGGARDAHTDRSRRAARDQVRVRAAAARAAPPPSCR